MFSSLLIAVLTVVVLSPGPSKWFCQLGRWSVRLKNRSIMSLGLPLLKWSFTAFHSSNWHPLTWFSHALDYAIWGLNPMGHHLTSVVLHGLNTFLGTILAFNLTNLYIHKSLLPDIAQQRLPSFRLPLMASAITGLLFGLHPLHVESVVWVSERKDVLCAFFFLLCILSYLRYTVASTGKRARRHYLLSVVFFTLALMSKPMAVTLPAVLLILDFCPLERFSHKTAFTSRRRILIEKIPFFCPESRLGRVDSAGPAGCHVFPANISSWNKALGRLACCEFLSGQNGLSRGPAPPILTPGILRGCRPIIYLPCCLQRPFHFSASGHG